ncbi:MAG: 50S ribosomal protein L22 [Bacteroidetes bacterium HGW-Bacteroidetes-6]|jgi:large subunit ribosomal protein L22|nr:MAG: 50S ribosomal protein L22 [Bacteroidetes bacterium HGW-Bacteroidetes-6]
MGARKRISAEKRKEAKKSQYTARLTGCPVSPRKMRPVVRQLKGKNADIALAMLKTTVNGSSEYLYKLLTSAINNWQQKTDNKVRIEDAGLYVKSVSVDGARMLKRIQPAPQGRAHRIRKRSNHVTIELGSRFEEQSKVESQE